MSSDLWSPALLRILLAQLAFGFSWCLYLVYPKYLALALGAGPAQIGSVATTAGLISSACTVLVAPAIDRSRRKVFACGCVLLVLSSLGYVCVERFGALVYVLQAGVAVSYQLSFNAAMASVTDVAPPARLGQAFGLQSAANLSMNAVSTLTAEQLAQRYGWRCVFALAALSSIVALLFGAGLPRSSQRASARESDVPLACRALLPAFGVASLLGAAYVALAIFHQPYALALGVQRVSSFFAGFTLAALAMRLGFGNLGDRLGRRRVVLAGLALYALVAWTVAALDPAWLWLYGAGFGVAHGVVYPTLIALATERVPAGAQGRAIAAFSGCFSLGVALGASGWGALSSRVGFPSVFAASSVCMLIACIVLLATRRAQAG